MCLLSLSYDGVCKSKHLLDGVPACHNLLFVKVLCTNIQRRYVTCPYVYVRYDALLWKGVLYMLIKYAHTICVYFVVCNKRNVQ